MNIHIGIDVGGTTVKYGAIDTEGHILFSDRTPTRGDEGRKATIGVIVGCAEEMVSWAKDNGHKPVSIGVGTPGTTNPETNAIQPPSPNLPVIIGVNFPKLIHNKTGLPATIDNDANCAAWAEYRYGAGRGIDNLVCLTVGSGIGSGFIVDGRIHSGPSGSGGELGHVTIDYNGPRCTCGNHGCLENYTSATAMMRFAREAADANPDSLLAGRRDPSSGEISVGGLFDAAKEGDEAAVRILDQAAFRLALGILSAVNICDPESVILGGGVADVDHRRGGRWLESIGEHIHAHAFSDAGKRLPVGRAVLGNDAGFIGAAALGTLRAESESD